MIWFTISSFLFLIWTIINSLFMPKLKPQPLHHYPLISILVPLRNEEKNVHALLETIRHLQYPNWACILLDDQSTDRTKELVDHAIAGDTRFTCLTGAPLQTGWVGKVHACAQLGANATGSYLLFLDADVRLHPHTLEAALHELQKKKAKLLTGFPAFPVTTMVSKLLVPLQQFTVFFHLPLAFANYTLRTDTTAAHGAFLFFERNAYEQIGGHTVVKHSLVEDVHITRAMKRAGFRVVLANITSYVTCFMYDTNQEAWDGFTKNIFVGLGRSIPLVVFLSIFYSIFFIVPFFLLPWTIWPACFLLLQRLYIDWQTKQKWWLCFLQPFALGTLIVLMYYSMSISLRKKSYHWKGRQYL